MKPSLATQLKSERGNCDMNDDDDGAMMIGDNKYISAKDTCADTVQYPIERTFETIKNSK